jgi:hypothetical protein
MTISQLERDFDALRDILSRRDDKHVARLIADIARSKYEDLDATARRDPLVYRDQKQARAEQLQRWQLWFALSEALGGVGRVRASWLKLRRG